MPALLHRHPQDVATVSVSASLIAPHSSNSRHMPRSRPAACAAAWSLSSADPGASDVHCILPSPDAARLPHLQQLARGADRRLLIGSATLAVAGLAFALRGRRSWPLRAWRLRWCRRCGWQVHWPAAASPATAWRSWSRCSWPWHAPSSACRRRCRSPCCWGAARPSRSLAGVAGRQRRHARAAGTAAGGCCTVADAAAGRDARGLTLFLGQVAQRLRQQTEALGHGPRRLAALARDIATGADLGAHADTGAYAPGSLAHAWPTLRATCRPSGDAKPRRMPRTRRSARHWMRRARR